MDRAKASSPQRAVREHDDDTKRGLLLEYDTADFRGRHDLLAREEISVRDIARWRRETATRATAGHTRPARATPKTTDDAPSGAADAPGPLEVAPAQPTPARKRRSSTSGAGQPQPKPQEAIGPLSALRNDVVAAHASALIYHAGALTRLVAEAPGQDSARRRNPGPIDKLADAADKTMAAARQVLAAHRRAGGGDVRELSSIEVSTELTDMLSNLTDYSSLAVAVQLLARELATGNDADGSPARRQSAGDRQRRPWWGLEDSAVDADQLPARERTAWGAKREAQSTDAETA